MTNGSLPYSVKHVRPAESCPATSARHTVTGGVVSWVRDKLRFAPDAAQRRAEFQPSRRILNCTRQWGKSTSRRRRSLPGFTVAGSYAAIDVSSRTTPNTHRVCCCWDLMMYSERLPNGGSRALRGAARVRVITNATKLNGYLMRK